MNIKVGDRVVLKDDCMTYTIHARQVAVKAGCEEELLSTGFVHGNWADELAPASAGGLKGTVVLRIDDEYLAVELDDYKNTRYAVTVVFESDVAIDNGVDDAEDATDHLLESSANAQRLYESIAQLHIGQTVSTADATKEGSTECKAPSPAIMVHVVERLLNRKGAVCYILQYKIEGTCTFKMVVEETELVDFLDEMRKSYFRCVLLEVNDGVV
ncbi:hypothetical protein [Pseudomonas phage PhL_UNISO_PA-DSM_ph0034]|uniref:Uncharacterized protein n=1 Tax=Pseudomonas phage PhL_UNISO_PA-DSM_ph0034 TaxID=2812900 RepID=A0A9E6U3V6_9CAUD|nr:hypothetical protein QE329_gp010 [Pseudomonas phage PhL_UNISO_PA-DSM_ph0034]QYC95130.1 hypothetical protein [Pseudomonas phage PhL_UNISO_PA-DSM_ph0034]WKC57514.1 hypothetical protein EPA3_097 [Pseudomonas phage vB_PaM_EPA3]